MPKKIAVVAITRNGVALAGRIVAACPGAQLFAPEKFRAEAQAAAPAALRCYAGRLGEQMPALFALFDGIVCVFSLGAVVRLIAPHVRDKKTDPALVVIDEAGRFVIPLLSGHVGGGNRLAGDLARAIGALPVLTTASDAQQTIAVDLLGRELGWTIDASAAEIVHCSAAMVNGEAVALVQEAGSKDWWRAHANGRSGALPANVTRFARIEDLDANDYAAVLWISRRQAGAALAGRLAGKCVRYRPAEEE